MASAGASSGHAPATAIGELLRRHSRAPLPETRAAGLCVIRPGLNADFSGWPPHCLRSILTPEACKSRLSVASGNARSAGNQRDSRHETTHHAFSAGRSRHSRKPCCRRRSAGDRVRRQGQRVVFGLPMNAGFSIKSGSACTSGYTADGWCGAPRSPQQPQDRQVGAGFRVSGKTPSRFRDNPRYPLAAD